MAGKTHLWGPDFKTRSTACGLEWPPPGDVVSTAKDAVDCWDCIAAATAGSKPKDVLPTDPAERKAIPLCSGVLDYFPAALAYIARISKAGNDQHNPGEPLHWARGKSMDHPDCVARHLLQRGTIDKDGWRHTGKMAWRALAELQEELEREEGAPVPRGARETQTQKSELVEPTPDPIA